MEHESNGDTSCNLRARYNHQMIDPGIGNKRVSWDHPNYNIIEIGLNTEKSLGHLKRHAVTQTPVENHQLMLVWKTLK